jgi:hypothetical protein
MGLKGHAFRRVVGRANKNRALAPEETPLRWWEKGEVPQRLKPLLFTLVTAQLKQRPLRALK